MTVNTTILHQALAHLGEALSCGPEVLVESNAEAPKGWAATSDFGAFEHPVSGIISSGSAGDVLRGRFQDKGALIVRAQEHGHFFFRLFLPCPSDAENWAQAAGLIDGEEDGGSDIHASSYWRAPKENEGIEWVAVHTFDNRHEDKDGYAWSMIECALTPKVKE